MVCSNSRPGMAVARATFALSLLTIALAAHAAQPPQASSAPAPQTSPNDQGQQGVPTYFDTVVVTATREDAPTREITSNVTVLDEEDIKSSTAKTLTDLIVEQGFNAITYNDSAGVQIRGFGQLSGPPEHTNTVLVLVNGRRTGNANLTLVGLKNVERVEIIRGPSAVQFGSSAMGGVINIITKNGTAGPSASVEFGVGSDSLARQQMAFSGAAKGFDVALGLSNYGRDDMTTSGGRQWYHTGIDHNANVNADAGYSFNPNNRVSISHVRADIRSELSSTGIRPYSQNTPTAAYTEYQKRTNNTAFSYAGHTGSKVWDWSGNYSFGNYDQKPYANNLDTKFLNAQGGYTKGLIAVSFGLDDYSYESDPSSWLMKDTGVYAAGRARLADDRLIVSGGLRVDRYTNESSAMATAKNHHAGGSVGAAFLPDSWLKLRANYADGFKVPAPTQVAGDGALYYLPNLDLRPESSKTLEFGADLDRNHVSAGVTWFHANWDDRIVALLTPGTCSGGFGCYQYQNLRASILAGLEASLNADVAKAMGHAIGLEPYVTLTWLPTRKNGDPSQFITVNGQSNDTLPNTPDWMVSYGVTFTEPRVRLSSRLNAAYYGDVLTQDQSGTAFPSPYIHRPPGTVVNLSVDKALVSLNGAHNTLSVRFDVNNLFDGANEIYWNYPGQGRNVYVGLRYDY